MSKLSVPIGSKKLSDEDFAKTLKITLNGRTFLMNSFKRNLAAQTLISLEGSGITSIQWELCDGSLDTVLLTDLKEVLKLATNAIRDFWTL